MKGWRGRGEGMGGMYLVLLNCRVEPHFPWEVFWPSLLLSLKLCGLWYNFCWLCDKTRQTIITALLQSVLNKCELKSPTLRY